MSHHNRSQTPGHKWPMSCHSPTKQQREKTGLYLNTPRYIRCPSSRGAIPLRSSGGWRVESPIPWNSGILSLRGCIVGLLCLPVIRLDLFFLYSLSTPRGTAGGLPLDWLQSSSSCSPWSSGREVDRLRKMPPGVNWC